MKITRGREEREGKRLLDFCFLTRSAAETWNKLLLSCVIVDINSLRKERERRWRNARARRKGISQAFPAQSAIAPSPLPTSARQSHYTEKTSRLTEVHVLELPCSL